MSPVGEQRLLLDAIRSLAPRTVLVLAPQPLHALEAYAREQADVSIIQAGSLEEQTMREPLARFELGVVAGLLETLEPRPAAELVAKLRDSYCERVLLLVPSGFWRLEQHLALGLELHSSSEDGAWQLYAYDVDRYNPEREWNNPDDWANPENFKRFRW